MFYKFTVVDSEQNILSKDVEYEMTFIIYKNC